MSARMRTALMVLVVLVASWSARAGSDPAPDTPETPEEEAGGNLALGTPQTPREEGISTAAPNDSDVTVPPGQERIVTSPDSREAHVPIAPTIFVDVISINSQYCNWSHSMGPVCNYTGANMSVVVPEGLRVSPGQLEVEVHGAREVTVLPNCLPWIQVYSAGSVSTFPSEGGGVCRTWLRVYDSKVGQVEHGVKDLTLVGSEVSLIRLHHQRDFMAVNSTITYIYALDWEGYRATIQNTSIERVSGLVARDNWYVLNSHLGFVTPNGIVFHARDMSIINSTVDYISSQGFTVKSGAVSLTNVTFEFLEAEAIEVISPSAFLSLTNVSIHGANQPCIVLLDRERIALVNVTVNNLPLNISSPYLKFLEDDGLDPEGNVTQVKSDTPGCSAQGVTLTCDFQDASQMVEVQSASVQQFRRLDLRNISSLTVTSTGCHTELRLDHVNATLPHAFPAPSDPPHGDPCTLNVTAFNSSLNVISVKNITSLEATDTTIKRMHGGQLEYLELTRSSVNEMDLVEVVGRGARWNESLFLGPMVNVTLRAPLISYDVHIHVDVLRTGSLTLDHPGQTSEVSGLRVAQMGRHSMRVMNGSNVRLNRVQALSVEHEAVYLEEGASSVVSNLRAVHDAFHVFSVHSKDQVELGDAGMVGLGELLVHVRAPPGSQETTQTNNMTVTGLHTSPYCRTIPFFLQICDFTSAPERDATVDLANGRRSNRVIVKGAETVTLYPSCVEKVILMEVDKGTTAENGRDCATWLEATGVHLTNLTYGVHDVTLTNCRVDLLAPDRQLRDLDLEGTTVERLVGVSWKGYTGVFNNSHLKRVDWLLAESRLMMSGSVVDSVEKGGLFVMSGGDIVNSSIGNVASGGITLSGTTRMQEVTLGSLASQAILVLDGVLRLTNVTIKEIDENGILAGRNGGVAFQNVTVGGQRVVWRGFLMEGEAYNHSLTFPHVKSPVPQPFTTPTPTPATRSATGSSREAEASSRVQGASIVTPMAESPNEAAWRWAGAGIGFLLGLVVGCCVLVAVKVVRPNRGRLSMPTVLWRVKEDQQELLEESIKEDSSSNCRDSQSYHAIPGSDVL